jgi:hypothetical protein
VLVAWAADWAFHTAAGMQTLLLRQQAVLNMISCMQTFKAHVAVCTTIQNMQSCGFQQRCSICMGLCTGL